MLLQAPGQVVSNILSRERTDFIAKHEIMEAFLKYFHITMENLPSKQGAITSGAKIFEALDSESHDTASASVSLNSSVSLSNT